MREKLDIAYEDMPPHVRAWYEEQRAAQDAADAAKVDGNKGRRGQTIVEGPHAKPVITDMGRGVIRTAAAQIELPKHFPKLQEPR